MPPLEAFDGDLHVLVNASGKPFRLKLNDHAFIFMLDLPNDMLFFILIYCLPRLFKYFVVK